MIPVTHYFPHPDRLSARYFMDICKSARRTRPAEPVMRTVDQWIDNAWLYTGDGRLTLRQPYLSPEYDPAKAWINQAGELQLHDQTIAAARTQVRRRIENRKTTVASWRTISNDLAEQAFFTDTPLRFRGSPASLMADFGSRYMSPLMSLQGILVAEDADGQSLHILFDGGQGLLTKDAAGANLG